MLKIIGALLVLAACIGYALSLLGQARHRGAVLAAGRELTELLIAEIRYERLPMADILESIRQRIHPDIGSVLTEVADGLQQGRAESLDEIWKQSFANAAKTLGLAAQEQQLLEDIGRNLGYLDEEAQSAHLRGCGEKIGYAMERWQKSYEEQKKVYLTFSLAAGIFLILILI